LNNLVIKFRSWCDRNISIITFFALLVTVLAFGYSILNGTKINFGSANNFLSHVATILNYKIELPLYVYLLSVIMVYSLFLYVRNSNRSTKKEFSFLVGTWLNEWDLNGKNAGSETAVIKDDSGYYRNGEHIFNVEDFKINYKNSQISFDKVSVRQNDHRRSENKLTIVNKDLLLGNEAGYPIRYTRIK
jgi:hypothetical protein